MNRPTSIEIWDKQQRAIDLRIAGLSLSEIASQLGYDNSSGSVVSNLIKNALIEQLGPNVEELRGIYDKRYETIISSLWPSVLQGDLQAIDRVLKVIKQQTELHGLQQMPLPREQGEYGAVEWQNPMPQKRQELLRGRIALIEDNVSSMTQENDSESLPAEPDGEKTLQQ